MRLEISCQDRLGITQDVLDILVEYEIDLRGIEIDKSGKIFLHFPNIDFAEFQHLMPKIRRIEGIEDVKTTPFMPIEREQNQLKALLKTLPDPVFSIDTKGQVLLVNEAVLSSLESEYAEIIGQEITELVKGFNFARWMDGKEVYAQTHKVKFIEQDFLADILPVKVSDGEGGEILAGAVLLLKSEYRLGQQLTVFHQISDDSFSQIQAQSSQMKRVVREAKRWRSWMHLYCFSAKPAPAKSLSPGLATRPVAVAPVPFWYLTALLYPMKWQSRSCLVVHQVAMAMNKVRWVCWSRHKAAPCFWMKSETCHCKCRPSCCGYCRMVHSDVLETHVR